MVASARNLARVLGRFKANLVSPVRGRGRASAGCCVTAGFSMNGFSMNGLASQNGLMTTYGGREVIKHMVKRAYPSGQSVVKQDQYGTSYTFYGQIGIAPELAAGPCDLDCQEKISACMLAHVNNPGQHISIWMVGPDPDLASTYGQWTFFAVGPVSAATTSTGTGSTVTTGGTNPCASFCTSPTVFTSSNYQAGALRTGAACRETTASISGLNLSNIAGRTFKVNGVSFVSDGNISALPDKVNGGYCFQATAGGLDYASFATW